MWVRTGAVAASLLVALGSGGCGGGPGSVDVTVVGRFGPDTSGATTGGLRVELDTDDEMTVLGVPADEAALPELAPDRRRFGSTFGGCVLDDVSYSVVDGRLEAAASFDESISCAQQQVFVEVVDVAAADLG